MSDLRLRLLTEQEFELRRQDLDSGPVLLLAPAHAVMPLGTRAAVLEQFSREYARWEEVPVFESGPDACG